MSQDLMSACYLATGFDYYDDVHVLVKVQLWFIFIKWNDVLIVLLCPYRTKAIYYVLFIQY